MSTIEKFQDIDAWKKARKLTKKIYSCSGAGKFAKDFGLSNQIRRASISIMSNIAEGFERSGSAEFAQFLSIAKGSTGEVKTRLYVALDQGYIDREQFNSLIKWTSTTKQLIAGFMKYLKKSNIKGLKYKSWL